MTSPLHRVATMTASTFSFHRLGACRNTLMPFNAFQRRSSSMVSFPQCLKFIFPLLDLRLQSAAKFSSSTLTAQSCAQAESVKPTSDSVDSGFKRPEVIEWQKNLINRVDLIGRVGRDVDIKYLDSGKVVAHSVLQVSQNPTKQDKSNMRITLEFWDELAEIAAAHLKQNDCIYVSGSVFVDTFVGRDNLQKTTCKVKARDLKYVQASNPADLEDEDHDQIFNQKNTLEEQWQDYFANPLDWWDNRLNKRNPNSPDFKNKTSGTALWISSWSTPSWVKARLEEQGQMVAGPTPTTEAGTESESLWQAFFANPSEWWDNRDMKKTPKHPDFKHKATKEALWIDSRSSPAWVKSQLEALDLKANAARQTQEGKKVEWLSSSKEIANRRSSFQEEDLNFF